MRPDEVMRTQELDWIEPVEALRRVTHLPFASLLDSAMVHRHLGQFSYLAADPFGIFAVEGSRASWNGMPCEGAAPLDALRKQLARCRLDRMEGAPPFFAGAIGTIAYDFGWQLDERKRPPSGERDVELAFFDVFVVFDHVERRCWIYASGLPEISSDPRRLRAEERLAFFADLLRSSPPIAQATEAQIVWRQTISSREFCAGVERVRDYIRAGDIYQANIAQRFVGDVSGSGDLWQLYERLREANPAPFAAFLAQGTRTVLSTSPELFLRSDGVHVETRPIKGTTRRRSEPALDTQAAEALQASVKDRAENVMIVDLLRNDLSRVCRAESVEVDALCSIESYAGLHHLVSVVRGELTPGCDGLDLLAACFPGGSITGAPKLRAMEIIDEIEARQRGLYCGAIGAFGFDGGLMTNIAIRTVVVTGSSAELCVGGGITLLSDPLQEYEETLLKAHRIIGATEASTRTGVSADPVAA